MKEHNSKNTVSEPCRRSESRDLHFWVLFPQVIGAVSLPLYTQPFLLAANAQDKYSQLLIIREGPSLWIIQDRVLTVLVSVFPPCMLIF